MKKAALLALAVLVIGGVPALFLFAVTGSPTALFWFVVVLALSIGVFAIAVALRQRPSGRKP